MFIKVIEFGIKRRTAELKNKHYNYNEELIAPQRSINCNRNNPVIAWREKKSIQRMKEEIRNYQPSSGLRSWKMKYRSHDLADIAYYLLETHEEKESDAPCMIYYHGGGFMMPLQTMMLKNAEYYVKNTGCKVFLPEYRYAPNVPCMTTIEDCYYMVTHIRKNYKKYGINPEKIIIYGDSAGGALAASVTHLMRERGLSMALGQMLIYPAMDCCYEKHASMEEYCYAFWPKSSNIYMWKLYLKGTNISTKKLAAPLNMDDFSGLPPAYVEPQEIDVLRDEAIAYARKLKEHGSLKEMNLIMGSYHGFDADHESTLVQRVLEHRLEVMKQFWEK